MAKESADLPSLRHLLREPTKTQLDEFRAEASELRKDAQRLGVLLEGGWTALGYALVWLVGMEAVLYLQMDQPDFLEELLDLVCKWELRRMELLLAEGVEVMVHSAWYENTDFWTPRNYRRLARDYERLAETLAGLHFVAFAIFLAHRFVTFMVQSA